MTMWPNTNTIPALAAGRTRFIGDLTPAQFSELQGISSEPGASEFIKFEAGSYQKMTATGPLMPASIDLNKNLLDP